MTLLLFATIPIDAPSSTLKEEETQASIWLSHGSVSSIRRSDRTEAYCSCKSCHTNSSRCVVRSTSHHSTEGRRYRVNASAPIQLELISDGFVHGVHDGEDAKRVACLAAKVAHSIQHRIQPHAELRGWRRDQTLSETVYAAARYSHEVGNASIGKHGDHQTASLLVVIQIIGLLGAGLHSEGWCDGVQRDVARGEVGQRCAGVILIVFVHFVSRLSASEYADTDATAIDGVVLVWWNFMVELYGVVHSRSSVP
mmetsp:Transcript_5652/g.15310  ORF Transcript_5652/g.15310 Transcript_5652/m.15310 type:complete len:254 (-) Transcript_5652:295-1056(-)